MAQIKKMRPKEAKLLDQSQISGTWQSRDVYTGNWLQSRISYTAGPQGTSLHSTSWGCDVGEK